MVGMAGGIVDANQFSDYVKVGDKLAIALLRHAEALERQHEVRHTNALEELAEKIDSLRNERAERPHRREKKRPDGGDKTAGPISPRSVRNGPSPAKNYKARRHWSWGQGRPPSRASSHVLTADLVKIPANRFRSSLVWQ
jgi:hypothetical protein